MPPRVPPDVGDDRLVDDDGATAVLHFVDLFVGASLAVRRILSLRLSSLPRRTGDHPSLAAWARWNTSWKR